MKVFLDTSILVAAALPFHQRHTAILALLGGLKKDRAEVFVAGHSLLEAYATLSSFPCKPRISPGNAWRLLHENFGTWVKAVTLNEGETWAFLEQAKERMLAGGRIYDASLCQCARKSGAQRWYTLNPKDFIPLAPAGVEVVEPH